ncbi:MAG: zinc ribbon domain-containing protein [Clostridiales bacterium]|nr:zinc ribbon domain-containing protein [Clostridiales bacterium]
MFCSNCGKRLPDDAEYCDNCNTPTSLAAESQGKKPGPAADVQHENAPSEGLPVTETEPRKEDEPQYFGFTAASSAGETALGHIGGELKDAATALIPGPAKAIGDGIKRLFSSIGASLKDPKSLIPAFVLAGIWLILNILRACGVDPFPVKALSFLTFAEGGMNGGFLGAVGGLIGKGVFAGAIVSLIGRLAGRKKDGIAPEKRKLSEALGFSADTLFSTLMGIGAAILLYLFISGGAVRPSFMAGAAAAYLSARAAQKNGFLKNLISSLTAKGKPEAGPGVTAFIGGLAAGFALASLIGLINIKPIIVIAGLVLTVGGAILTILRAAGVLKLGKGANAQ